MTTVPSGHSNLLGYPARSHRRNRLWTGEDLEALAKGYEGLRPPLAVDHGVGAGVGSGVG